MSPATLERILAVPWAALAVVAPLAAALAAICLGRFAARLAFPFASVIFFVVLATLLRVWTLGPVEHDIGGWPAPLGIRLRADGLSAAFMTISAIVASAVVAFSAPIFGPLETRFGFAFWPLLFFMWAGLNAVFVSGDLFNLYVAMELLSLTAVSMVGLEGNPAALAAAMRYLIFALLGSLAYSTIGGLAHLVHQGFMKITMFFCAGAFATQMRIYKIDELDGVGRAMPWTATAFTIGAFGMIGTPPIAGFVSKWYLGVGGVQAAQSWVVLTLAASSLLNAAYFLPLVYRAWFLPLPGDHPQNREHSVWLIAPAVVTALLSIAAGALAGLPYSPLGWSTMIVERYYFR
ncbi:proton-conducting transporter membrane subunit [Methylosinus sp. KRF6]|uniref:proton-conducting transporter transmembrane domain-containing protein n=1 Tax=Methylosinus sp. KRF6 TaxID=2846853 RepID=UPI001C0C6CD9|nr:proton-conducting transporter membrane subunit [Methylosinus sp. KRF6]MBU3888515.1 hypothetical protein [Methylosinus sp. KRF6]